MPPLMQWLTGKSKDNGSDDSSNEEAIDSSAASLSYVGAAAYEVLKKQHSAHHHELWNVTRGKVIGPVHLTPRDAFTRTETHDPVDGHDDWFPEKCGEIMGRCEHWCDVMSLAPPDGMFLDFFKKALADICNNAEKATALSSPVTIRMMFGNIVGMPVDCDQVLNDLTCDLPKDAPEKIRLWVGSWRKGVSWNHAKIIAVDGKYLWTGGHNFWDAHYLKNNPVCDLSLEMEGAGVARDAHRYANAQWQYIVKKQSTRWGKFVDEYVPDKLDVPRQVRVTVSEYPAIATGRGTEFPPDYKVKKDFRRSHRMLRGAHKQASDQTIDDNDKDVVPVITMGRYGAITKKSRPSDDAFVAMIDSAQHIIRLAVQDFGPACVPRTKIALPGCVWPDEYLSALARVIWKRGVDVEIVLSNPNSIPGGLTPIEANYGNGWTCVDVAAELIKRIQTQFPIAEKDHYALRQKVLDNLRVCYLRSPSGKQYKDGQTFGLHSKYFIIDDVCCYIGSQNLYICDLAEWGVAIDDAAQTQNIKAQVWDPMWTISYMEDDCNVDAVMDGLDIDRNAPDKLDSEYRERLEKMPSTYLMARDGVSVKVMAQPDSEDIEMKYRD